MPLTDAKIKALKPKAKPYKVADFDGLYLLVNPTGSKLWRFKYRVAGLFAPNDPLIPSTAMTSSLEEGFQTDGLSREHWKTTSPLRQIFADAFTETGLPAYTPHRFRDMLVREMFDRDLSIVEFRAWSLSLGHENPQTTLTIYGTLSLHEMERIIRPETQS